MWCKHCEKESFSEICEICGEATEMDICALQALRLFFNHFLFILLDGGEKLFAHKYHQRKAEGDEINNSENQKFIYGFPHIICTADSYAQNDAYHLFKDKS